MELQNSEIKSTKTLLSRTKCLKETRENNLKLSLSRGDAKFMFPKFVTDRGAFCSMSNMKIKC